VSAPTYDLGKLPGGLRLPAHKNASTAGPIKNLPVPAQLILPIEQHVGEPAQPVVGIGDRVLKGQLVAEPDGEMGAPIHASSSGTIVAIERWPVSRRHGDKAPCIIIECDGKDEAIADAPIEDYRSLASADLLLRILDGGIVGLGGAVFTLDRARGQRVARQMASGAVFVNEMTKSHPALPFGGIGASGVGRELARQGICAFVNAKTLWVHD